MPSLDLLAGFEAAARHLSFTKAGEELFLTQSAVSRQIKELEEQLGVALFHRRHRALVRADARRAVVVAVHTRPVADVRRVGQHTRRIRRRARRVEHADTALPA